MKKKLQKTLCITVTVFSLSAYSVSAQAGIFSVLSGLVQLIPDVIEMSMDVIPLTLDFVENLINVLTNSRSQNSQRAAQFSMLTSYQQSQQNTANSSLKQLNAEVFGALDQFESQLVNYKTPTKYGDCSNPNSPNCYDALSANSVTSTDTLQGPQLQAAQQFTKLSSGSATSIPAPNPNWTPTPQVVKYVNNYNTIAAAQSSQTTNASDILASRIPADGDGQNTSPYAFEKDTNYTSNVSSSAQNALQALPLFGWIFGIAHGVTSLIPMVSKGAESLTKMTGMMGSTNTMITHVQNQMSGNQMYQDALASQTGEPNKKSNQ